MTRFYLMFAAATLLSVPASAQDAPSPKDDIVVKGKRDKKEVQTFVRSLSPARDGRQVARWNGEVCARVIGLWPARDKMILDRVAAVAKTIDVRYDATGKCSPNTLIVFTGQADKFAAQAVDEFPDLIANTGSEGQPSKKDIARYLAPRPVRWFAINSTTMTDGTSVGTANVDGAGGAMGPLNVNAAARSVPASRLSMRTRENTVASLIIVDESKLIGIRWDQLADYLAMVTFAQPEIDADFAGTDSVMAIFTARDRGTPGAPGMTIQDGSFLTALYRAPETLSPDQQRGVIADALRGKADK